MALTLFKNFSPVLDIHTALRLTTEAAALGLNGHAYCA